MSNLPPRLRPLWPVFKRVHRFIALVLGFVNRALSPLFGANGVPRSAYLTSDAAAQAEDQIVKTGAGPAYRMSREMPWGEPTEHSVFVAGQHIDVDERYVLEVEGGRLVGDYGALVTPGGRLDYQTSTYFGLAGWREHPLYFKPTLGSHQHVQGRVLSLTSPGTATNYYHFLYDSIGRLEIVEKSGVDQNFDAVIVPHGSRYQRELLELAGVTGRFIQLDRGQSVTADVLVVPSTPNSGVIAPLGTVEFLRDRLLRGGPEAMSERIFITRGNAPGSRRYLQEDELWPQLEARGFRRIDPGTFSVREQIEMFSRAEIVVSPHGAGLTNITFAPGGVQVLEFFTPTYVHLGLWGICEALDGVRYRYLVGDGPKSRESLPRPFDDISLDPSRIIDVVDRMISETTHVNPA